MPVGMMESIKVCRGDKYTAVVSGGVGSLCDAGTTKVIINVGPVHSAERAEIMEAEMLEKDIQKKILDHFNKNKIGHFFKFHNGPYGARGVSDIVGTYKGLSVFIEVKAKNGRTTKMQEKFLRDVRAEGAVAGVATSVEEAMGLVAQAKMIASALGLEPS